MYDTFASHLLLSRLLSLRHFFSSVSLALFVSALRRGFSESDKDRNLPSLSVLHVLTLAVGALCSTVMHQKALHSDSL